MIEDVHCPAPQPEDRKCDGDPGFREDPDIYIEFDDGVFYQASCDGASVAIIANYPGLLPTSHVSQAEKPYPPKRTPFRWHALLFKCHVFAETTVGAWGRAPRDSSTTGVRIGQAREEGGEG